MKIVKQQEAKLHEQDNKSKKLTYQVVELDS